MPTDMPNTLAISLIGSPISYCTAAIFNCPAVHRPGRLRCFHSCHCRLIVRGVTPKRVANSLLVIQRSRRFRNIRLSSRWSWLRIALPLGPNNGRHSQTTTKPDNPNSNQKLKHHSSSGMGGRLNFGNVTGRRERVLPHNPDKVGPFNSGIFISNGIFNLRVLFRATRAITTLRFSLLLVITGHDPPRRVFIPAPFLSSAPLAFRRHSVW